MQINDLLQVSSHLFFVYLQRTRCVLYERTKSKAFAVVCNLNLDNSTDRR